MTYQDLELNTAPNQNTEIDLYRKTRKSLDSIYSFAEHEDIQHPPNVE